MCQIENLKSFVANFTDFPHPPNIQRYNKFLQQFSKQLEPTLDFLGEVGKYSGAIEDDPSTRVKDAKAEIYKLNDYHWGWNKNVDYFKKKIMTWMTPEDDNLFTYPWSTLRIIVEEYARRLPHMPPSSTGRELYTLLLAKLLPIYFVKAANISSMVQFLEQQLPDLVLLACERPKDYPELKIGNIKYSYAYSACRGFEPHFNETHRIHFLALIYNPEDEAIPLLKVQAQENKLEKLPEIAKRQFDLLQYYKSLRGDSPILV